jgi:hypothetical protein
MDAKTKTRLLWFALVIAVGVIVVSQWDGLFPPKDYEECAESAARKARSKEALRILVSACDSKFSGRRKPGGGYVYYDARQDRSFNIAGPNPTAEEMQYIEKQHSIYLEEEKQAEEDRVARAVAQAQFEANLEKNAQQARAAFESRRQAAVKRVTLISSNIDCRLSLTCGLYTLTVRVGNQSKENVSSLSFGWVFISVEDQSCPSSLPTKRQERVNLRPGDTTVLNIDGHDGPPSRQFRYCVLLTDLTIAQD